MCKSTSQKAAFLSQSFSQKSTRRFTIMGKNSSVINEDETESGRRLGI